MRLLRVLRSQQLPCGCFVGVYETYDGETVPIIDVPGPGCADPFHGPGRSVALPPAPTPSAAGDTLQRSVGAGAA